VRVDGDTARRDRQLPVHLCLCTGHRDACSLVGSGAELSAEIGRDIHDATIPEIEAMNFSLRTGIESANARGLRHDR
jgi:hypothetical protein